MDFQLAKKEAEKWLNSNPATLCFVSADESEKRLDFCLITTDGRTDSSFFVICPKSPDDKWHVWSENDLVLHDFSPIQDYVDSCKKKTVGDILKFTYSHLLKRLALPGRQDENSDESESNSDDDGGDDDDDGYYDDMGYDPTLDDDPVCKSADPEEKEEKAEDYFIGTGSTIAVQRLLKDLTNMKKSGGKFGIEGCPRDDNLFIWDVRLTDFPPSSRLGQDLHAYARRNGRQPEIDMEMQFPSDYPLSPPFVRILRPRFKFLTGHVTVGGSICMEMLTTSGWRPTNDIEGILIQIRAEIMSDNNAALATEADRPYTEEEARTAFSRMVQRYGWG